MKNLLLFSSLLLTTAGAFAQLSVKPNTNSGTDSYVYVNDEVLYVTDYVNLTRNGTANDTEASIYLRNNGQLIQGGTTSNNSGDGQLSVQQNTPETNAWAYYYWCSPIGNPGNIGSPNPTGNRSFGVNFLYEPNASSLTGASKVNITTGRDGLDTTTPITVSTRWLYTHPQPGTEAEGHYIRMNSGNNAPPGFGFTMKGVGLSAPGGDQVYEFRGRPNNGNFSIPVAAPVAGVPQMTLSGNPYPSAMDLNKLFYDLPDNNELSTFWYYDEDRTVASHYYSQKPFGYGVYTVGPEDTDNDPYDLDNLGTYSAAPFYYYTAAGGTTGGAGSSTNSDDNKRFAPIGQGIMFVGNATGNVEIKNSYRVFYKEDTAGSVFQRPEGSSADQTSENEDLNRTDPTTARPDYRTPSIRIWSIFDEAVTRDMVIAFYDQATDGYDRGLDGLSAQDLQTDAYFPIGDDNNRKPYVINGIKYEQSKQVPIAFKIKNQSKVDIKAVEEIKKPYEHAYLFDRVENNYQQITGGRSATLNLPAGRYENRFFIVFRNANVIRDVPETELETKKIVLDNVTLFQNNPVQQLEINNPEGYIIKSASVYDMNGKLVISESNLGANNKYSFYTGNLSDGVYLVKLMTADDIAIDYKAIVHNK
ncbi:MULTISPECIES: T9SS type A sorting domain-containing protein [Aequorivita]|uniref:T9SS type A sorting domain-containing protein n=1 Tax=Aequorivita iocasae TaxID=2803865 RepID=A0ABX7DPK1_9FLAO|nr:MULTISPECIES: T9SS type A sorting domain-containing protein [Aequorivita]QQX76071.1 T9SS type A sorting domain-containing protein [Aequorivita iocasae]UCA55531.1 T9SS type A sorting domain-containing protein [Aequorivita sp. F7]